jgi:ribosomal protein L11 methyltransferase
LIRLAVRCGTEAAERVLAELLELAPNGVEEDAGPGWVEYAIYGAEGELPDLGAVEAVAGDQPIDVSSAEVPDDWADRWRDFHRPVPIADGRVVIRPSWESPPAASSAPRPGAVGSLSEPASPVDVLIDPGRAFGTGAHPTTRMCVELLLELADEGRARGTLVDLGTGSGVLAIAAAKLGFGPVLGVDNEVAALEAAATNAATNGVELELARVNLRTEVPPLGETVVANLTASLLRDVAAGLVGHEDRTPRVLVCSGLLASEVSDIGSEFADVGLARSAGLEAGDWAALRLERR